MMKLSAIGALYALYYTDSANIWRGVEKVLENGAVDTSFHDELAQTNVPCRISFRNHDKPGDTAVGTEEKITGVRLFFRASEDIRAGDRVVAMRTLPGGQMGRYEGHVGQPALYETHIEVDLIDRRFA